MSEPIEKLIKFGCCFCSKPIEGRVDAIVLLAGWGTADEQSQQFWCHLECCVQKMDPSFAEHVVIGEAPT